VAGFMELAAFCEKNVHFIEMYHCPYFTAFFSFVKVFRLFADIFPYRLSVAA